MATPYAVPEDDRPRFVDWAAGTDDDRMPVELRWWVPATVHHGGRDARVVIDSKGEMTIFHGRERTGTAAAPYSPSPPQQEDFWPLAGYPAGQLPEPAELSHRIRDTGWMVCLVDAEIGLAAGRTSDDGPAMLWRLAHACVLLGFYPPMGIEFEGWANEFTLGINTIGERPARQVKRAIMARVAHDRRLLSELGNRIDTYWRVES
jgi:hypothetical protein